MEYLIRPTDGEWFDLPFGSFPEVLRPISLASETTSGWGDHRIRVRGSEIAFSHEDSGIQIIFADSSLVREVARRIVQEIQERIIRATGQGARIIELD